MYAGAGLFSAAFRDEGFHIHRAVELDTIAAATYAHNVGSHVEIADVRTTKPSGKCEVLVAGPPCQGFSTLNRMRADDPRNSLSLEVVRWARATNPDIVVIENVAAFVESQVWQCLRRRLVRDGYQVDAVILNALDFGVPQIRRRSFTIASRVGLPTIKPLRRRGVGTVKEAWDGLPSRPNGRNLHLAPRPSALALARMKLIPPGGDRRDVLTRSPRLAPPSWKRLNCAVTDVWGRMQWGKPSNTLRTALQNPSKGRYIHPSQHRVISLREAARLHSVDDSWEFAGTPTQIARQLGNSVPPALGRAVARAISKLL